MIITPEQKIHRYSPDDMGFLADADKNLKRLIECTYVTYMREDLATGLIHYYSSNPYWQDIFIGQRLINDCSICSAGARVGSHLGTSSILPLVWNHIDHNTTKESKEIHELRESKNIANGIGLILINKSIRESISFAGKKNDVHFYKRILHNSELVKFEIENRRKHLLGV